MGLSPLSSPINLLLPLSVVDSEDLYRIVLTGYEHDLMVGGLVALFLSLTFGELAKHKRILTVSLLVVSAVYLNNLYFWTSMQFRWPLSIYIYKIEDFYGHAFMYLGMSQPHYPIDLTSALLLGLIFACSFFSFGLRRAIQVCCLMLLPLPIDVFVFDRQEFNLFVISDFSYPFLAWITNAVVLYADLAVLGIVSAFPILKRVRLGHRRLQEVAISKKVVLSERRSFRIVGAKGGEK